MSFNLKGFLLGESLSRTVIIDNSDTITMGDAVKLRNGNVEVASADGAVSGVVTDIVDKNGNSVFGSLAVLGSATVTGSPSSGSVTVAADNETVDLIAVKVEMSPYALYSATVTGTIGTTVNSDKIGVWIDNDDEDSVEETTANRTIGTGGVFKGWGVDPEDSTRMLVSINEHEFFGSNSAVAQA